jgi:ABC-type sugar transport system ATPase subunit
MAVIDEGVPEEGEPADVSEMPVLRVSGLSKRYEGVQALDDVSLDVEDNEVLALVGDNGAGKSTLIKLLTGVIDPTGGTLHVRENGSLVPRTIDDPNEAQEIGIETVFQDLGLSGQHDVASNVFMGREPVRDDLFGSLLRRVDREQMERRSVEALEEIGFSVDPTARTAELSGGQQQAIAVARALISDPKIVLLDEPTAEVSVEGSEKILDLVERLQKRGLTVVFISHNLEEVLEVADRIAVLRDGRLVKMLENDGSVTHDYVVGLMTGAQAIEDEEGSE